MNKLGIGYVVLRKKNSTGILFEEPTVELLKKKKSVIIHEEGGSGFIVKKFEKPFKIKGLRLYALGFVLTAAHTCYNFLNCKPNKAIINCGFLENEIGKMQLIPIKNWLKDSADEIFASNGNAYCLPGDVAICLLVSNSKSIEIEELPLDRCKNKCRCKIIGFPNIEIANPVSIFPYNGNDENLARKTIKKVFHRKNCLVKSKGKIVCNKELLEISCSGINGMSESPIVVKGHAVGIFCGGPPLPGQREIIILASMIKEDINIQDIWSLLTSLKDNDQYYRSSVFRNLCYDFNMVQYIATCFLNRGFRLPKKLAHRKRNLNVNSLNLKGAVKLNKNAAISKVITTIFDCLAQYKKPEEFSFNVAVSTNLALFDDIANRIENFSHVDRKGIFIEDIYNFFVK